MPTWRIAEVNAEGTPSVEEFLSQSVLGDSPGSHAYMQAIPILEAIT